MRNRRAFSTNSWVWLSGRHLCCNVFLHCGMLPTPQARMYYSHNNTCVASGASGFQLINVSSVPLQLKAWRIGRGGNNANVGFMAQKALVQNLLRHYTTQILREAHKVCSGVGPAVAALPLTVVWAGGSAVELVRHIGAGRLGPLGVAQQVGFIVVMGMSQVISGFSRLLALGLTTVPPVRSGDVYSDQQLLKNSMQRPVNVLDAYVRGADDMFTAMATAVTGIVKDPAEGYARHGLLGVLMGAAKATLALPLRPVNGLLELGTKVTYGSALVFLGREGIYGAYRRRVRAPGMFREEVPVRGWVAPQS